MHSLRKWTVAAGLFALALAAAPVRADVSLPAGGNVSFTAETGTFLSGAALVAQDTVNADVGANPNIGGNLAMAVVRETSGTLDFLYQFRNNTTSSSPVNAVSVSNYTGIATSVGSLSGVPALVAGVFQTPSTAGPASASRGLTGDPVTFSGFAVAPAGISGIFFVRTDTPFFDQLGTALASSSTSGLGSDVFVNKFEPTAAPEPGPLALAAVAGGLAFAAARLRRKFGR
jgi:hypothetical protein